MPRIDLLQFPSDRDLAAGAALELLAFLGRTRSDRSRNTVAFSGGRIARIFYQEIVARASSSGFRPDGIEVFWADERCVPPDHAESNYALAKQRLLDPLGIPDPLVHRILGEEPPAEAAADAERELTQICKPAAGQVACLDLVILGMGEDGHVASLFPGDDSEDLATALHFRSVVAVKPPPNRVTLTYRALVAAREVWVLASGQGKAEALSRSLLSTSTPLGRLRSLRKTMRIFTDF